MDIPRSSLCFIVIPLIPPWVVSTIVATRHSTDFLDQPWYWTIPCLILGPIIFLVTGILIQVRYRERTKMSRFEKVTATAGVLCVVWFIIQMIVLYFAGQKIMS